MRLRSIRGVLGSIAVVAMVSWSLAACGAGGDKNGATGGPDGGGDSSIQLDGGTGLCNACVGTVYQTCDSSGKVTSTTDCAPRTCVAGKGCLDCAPGGNTCVGNEVHACTDSGSVGPLVTTCDPGKGEVCSNGTCKNACDVAADSPSNVGCEFWAVDLDCEYSSFDDAAGAPWGVVIANTSSSTANVVIEKNDAPLGAPVSLTTVYTKSILPGSLDEVTLPTREVDGSVKAQDDGPGTFVSSNAYRITSTSPLVVYQFNPLAQTFSNDASLLLPRNGLGTVHRVLGWPTANPINPGIPIAGIPDHSFVTIVGTAPSTTVTVTLGSDIVGGGGIPATKKGGVITQTLGPFDVLNLESDGLYGDMTGTIVESTAPVAVFTGGERGIAPYGDPFPPAPPSYDASKGVCCTDHLEEQVFPVESMGKTFVIARSPIRSTGGYVEYDMIKFMGVAATTTVKTSLPPPDDTFTLAPGEARLTWTNADFVAEGTEPLAIAQILVSQEYTESPKWGGDPSLTIFPPVDQFRSNYLFLVPTSWEANFVVIAMPEGTNVTIDGTPIGSECDSGTAGDVAGVHYVSRRCPIKEGAHGVQGDKPFGVTAYGYGPVGSYAFTGGADVKKIYAPPPLH